MHSAKTNDSVTSIEESISIFHVPPGPTDVKMDNVYASRIRYTTNYFAVSPGAKSHEKPFFRRSQDDDEPFCFQETSEISKPTPVLEVTSNVELANADTLKVSTLAASREDVPTEVVSSTSLTVHSEALSKLIRETIEVYPGQNLSGNTLVFHEPYAALMHHMSDLEAAFTTLSTHAEEHTVEQDHLKTALASLLKFLRPEYKEIYIPAQERLSLEQPSITFDNLWVLFQPNSLAYAKLGEHWIGCKIGAVTRHPAGPDEEDSARWNVQFWFLETNWSTEEICCAETEWNFYKFDGERNPTNLDIVPCQLHDRIDSGSRRQLFEERGQRILKMFSEKSREYRYTGKYLESSTNTHLHDDVLIAIAPEDTFDEYDCVWKSDIAQPGHTIPRDGALYSFLERRIDTQRDHCNIFTDHMRFMLSPCLSAWSFKDKNWHLIHADYLQPPKLLETMPEPILHQSLLHNIMSLVDSQRAKSLALERENGTNLENRLMILLKGESGVGKSYTAKYVSWKMQRPLITLPWYILEKAMDSHMFDHWLRLIQKSDAILLLKDSEVVLRGRWTVQSFINSLDRSYFEGVIFMTAREFYDSDFRKIAPRIDLAVTFSPLDHKRQQKLWLKMIDFNHFQQDTDSLITIGRSVSSFLSSPDMPKIDWNGHEIRQCFRIAISCAQAAVNEKSITRSPSSVLVEIEHFKQAMNIVFATRLAFSDDRYADESGDATGPGEDEVFNDNILNFGRGHEYDELSSDDSPPQSPIDGGSPALGSRPSNKLKKANLCISELNMVEWSTFKTLGTTELFRTTKFYAIDVLVGTPHIQLEIPGLMGQKRRIPIQTAAPQPAAATANSQQGANELTANSMLPERIRINSPAIIKAFSGIQVPESSSLRGSFLLFRPYKVLSYYEKDLRDWTKQLEDKSKANSTDPDTNHKGNEETLQADIAEMDCLLSFMDTYMKERQQQINDCVITSVTFDDLWFMFKPGHTVIEKDGRQAYRVIRVATTRHEIVERNATKLSFFKEDSPAEFEKRCVFVKCVHIDFDGQSMGPVAGIFTFQEFNGRKPIASLPIYPIRFSKEPGIEDFLIHRGKQFFEAGGIKHMHYKGLTLPEIAGSKLRDEVDSQVVIDFEEALNRYSEWKPLVTKTVLDENDTDDSPERFRNTQEHSEWKCISECCGRETVYHDNSIDDRTRNDYMASQANENSTAPSLVIEAKAWSDISDPLKDDDYLIMSFRVFGFVFRSRKWHQLDLADASPAESDSDGFDQLVLPKGHKKIVKSMVAKHFQDRRSSSSSDRSHADIVRGKGRGLIMLLHGEPGVGKTSTAECLAGVFNRPLFQITSGDLGVTAGDVDDNLEENFSLANRWNCILLIDEADVFLAQRNREDFVQNSLVAVFLRIMEYYSGILFLTTNRVGVFDEAFSSRIHISLYYPALDREQTLEIFKKNWERILHRSKDDSRHIYIDQSEITQFAMDYFDNNKQDRRWNGRQIRNAFQSALAMAEFEVLDIEGVDEDGNVVSGDQEPVQTVKLGKKHFEEVAKAYKGFVDYLNKVHGAGSARRARENMWRFDPEDDNASKRPTVLSQRLKFTGDPMHQPSRNVDAGMGAPPFHRGYGPGYETQLNYASMGPPRGGGYSAPHEYQYSSATFPPRTHGMEQHPYPDHLRAPVPSANYPSAQAQTYGPRMHPVSQHEMQTAQSSWAGSSRDVQSGGYPYSPGEQTQRPMGGSNVRWENDAGVGGGPEGT